MKFSLPKIEKDAIELTHFPTKHQAFIFRAYEYIPAKKIAEILGTTEENVHKSAAAMGLPYHEVGDVWLKRGHITIVRSMWHILPYEQLFEPGLGEHSLKNLLLVFVIYNRRGCNEVSKITGISDRFRIHTKIIGEAGMYILQGLKLILDLLH